MADLSVRVLERDARFGGVEELYRLGRAVVRMGGSAYALERLVEHPGDELWRRMYVSLGGVFARLVEDNFLGKSLFVCLPEYEGKQENVVVGLGNLEEGYVDAVDNWLLRYSGRKDGVIVTPLKLETAVAVGMHSIRDVPFFAREVDEYRNSFRASVEYEWPAYGVLAYEQQDARVNLDELSLEGMRVSRMVDVPVLQDTHAVLAPAQEDGSQEHSALSENVELCLKVLTGSKNAARVLQYWASRRNGLQREIMIRVPDLSWRRQNPTRALALGRKSVEFIINCDVSIFGGPARGCRRVKSGEFDGLLGVR